ncbi:hypothetical protein ACFFSY_02490 [Paenibacillus aurantiacus]|uniref:Uncharacterized protein n=1 Tax=Paenibacillus aurantiacus TaxID=1936118 RepID=A0ABV5KKA9_9BACL
MFDVLERAIDETADGWFRIERAVTEGDNMVLTIALYQDVWGNLVRTQKHWELDCVGVQKMRLCLMDEFRYIEILDDHPALFNYTKPLFDVSVPRSVYTNAEMTGKFIEGIQGLLEPYFAGDFIADFVPDYREPLQPGEEDDYIQLIQGPQEIVDIVKRVYAPYADLLRIVNACRYYSDTGKERLMKMGTCHVIAADFTLRTTD